MQALVELHMPLMMTQESSVEVPFNKAALAAWISRCLEVPAVREELGNLAHPSSRNSSAHVNKDGPTFCGDIRSVSMAAEIVNHAHRVTELNKNFKKAESQRNKEKAAKQKTQEEAQSTTTLEPQGPMEFSLGEPIKADFSKEEKIAKTETQLKSLGIEYHTHQHPKAKTVAIMMEHIGHLGGGFCKNLFVKAKKPHPDRKDDSKLWLVVALVDAKVDLKALTSALGYPSKGELRFANAEQLATSLQCVQGEVNPFALVNDPKATVNVVLDKAMLEKDGLWFHPMTNEASTKVPVKGLLTYIEKSGRSPVMMDFEKE